jgi:hypothetical protein
LRVINKARRRDNPVFTESAAVKASFIWLRLTMPSRHNRASDLNEIIEVVGKKGLTHLEVARLAHNSRTRVTAILNSTPHDISTDLMLHVLASPGVRAKLQFKAPPKIFAAATLPKCF